MNMKNLFLVTIAVCCTCANSFASIQIVYGAKPGWIAQHTAEELAKYIEQMTAHRPELSANIVMPNIDRVFLIGDAVQNPAVENKRHIFETQLKNLSSESGFVIKSFIEKGVKYTVLAGKTPVASLYATYDYLERFCKVGFFEDGEYVPKLDELPFEKVDVVTEPVFEDRHYLMLFGHWGLKRFHSQFWTWPEWKRELDFLAKKKINLSRMHLRCSIDTFRGDVATRAFPEIGKPSPGYADSGGWPSTYNWPEEYRTELTKKILEYGRSLGIRFIYLIAYGDIPIRFKEKHPEIHYMPDDPYGPSTKIHPDDPLASEVTKQYLKTLINTFGTDHIYFDTPYAEASPGANQEEAIHMKTSAAINLCKVLKEVDPEAIWYYDAWDFLVGHIWTKEAVRQFIEKTPIDMTYIADNDSEMSYTFPNNKLSGGLEPMHKIHKYFYGRTWAYAVLHSYAGDDTPHGNLNFVIRQTKELVANPHKGNCRGFHIMPEKIGDNDLYYQLLLSLSWDPRAVQQDEFLKEYVLRRFGSVSQRNMYKSIKHIIKALYECAPDEINPCYYKMLREGMGGSGDTFPLLEGREYMIDDAQKKVKEKMDELSVGLQYAFAEKNVQHDNRLYENYIVEFGKQYFSEQFNYALLKTYVAFKAGDRKSFEENGKIAMSTLDTIERILASREDYILKNTIDQAMSVPDTNPATPRLIKQALINWNYIANDNFEQMRLVYKPRVLAYLEKLRSKIKDNVNQITWEDVSPILEKNAELWRESALPNPDTVERDIVEFIQNASKTPLFKEQKP